MKCRSALGLLCDSRIPIKLKRKFYNIAIQLAILYGIECWAIKKQRIHEMGVATIVETKILRWISENTLKDKIQNEKICLKIEVAPIDEKMMESYLK